jgi:hypothetical protein
VQKGVKLLRRNYKRPVGRSKGFSISLLQLQYIAVAMLILIGVVIGASLAGKSGSQSGIGVFMQEMLSKDAASKGFLSLLISSFTSSSLLLSAAFMLGLFALGSPGHILILMFKGAGIGFSMGYVYIEYGLKGFAICAFFILPWAVLTSFAVLIACREGICFSLLVIRTILPGTEKLSLWNDFCKYCFKFVFCFAIIIIATIIQVSSTIAFSALFFS